MQQTVATLLEHRQVSLGVRPVSVDFQTHRHRDSGCRTTPGSIINPLRNRYARAMIVFDFHGSGETRRTATQLEIDLEQDLRRAGWGQDAIAVVSIEPELEAWVFGASFQRLGQLIDWSQRQSIRSWLEQTGTLLPAKSSPRTHRRHLTRYWNYRGGDDPEAYSPTSPATSASPAARTAPFRSSASPCNVGSPRNKNGGAKMTPPAIVIGLATC